MEEDLVERILAVVLDRARFKGTEEELQRLIPPPLEKSVVIEHGVLHRFVVRVLGKEEEIVGAHLFEVAVDGNGKILFVKILGGVSQQGVDHLGDLVFDCGKLFDQRHLVFDVFQERNSANAIEDRFDLLEGGMPLFVQDREVRLCGNDVAGDRRLDVFAINVRHGEQFLDFGDRAVSEQAAHEVMIDRLKGILDEGAYLATFVDGVLKDDSLFVESQQGKQLGKIFFLKGQLDGHGKFGEDRRNVFFCLHDPHKRLHHFRYAAEFNGGVTRQKIEKLFVGALCAESQSRDGVDLLPEEFFELFAEIDKGFRLLGIRKHVFAVQFEEYGFQGADGLALRIVTRHQLEHLFLVTTDAIDHVIVKTGKDLFQRRKGKVVKGGIGGEDGRRNEALEEGILKQRGIPFVVSLFLELLDHGDRFLQALGKKFQIGESKILCDGRLVELDAGNAFVIVERKTLRLGELFDEFRKHVVHLDVQSFVKDERLMRLFLANAEMGRMRRKEGVVSGGGQKSLCRVVDDGVHAHERRGIRLQQKGGRRRVKRNGGGVGSLHYIYDRIVEGIAVLQHVVEHQTLVGVQFGDILFDVGAERLVAAFYLILVDVVEGIAKGVPEILLNVVFVHLCRGGLAVFLDQEGKTGDLLGQFVKNFLQRGGLSGNEKHPLLRVKGRSDHVGDGLGLARSRRTLHLDALALGDHAIRDLLLDAVVAKHETWFRTHAGEIVF